MTIETGTRVRNTKKQKESAETGIPVNNRKNCITDKKNKEMITDTASMRIADYIYENACVSFASGCGYYVSNCLGMPLLTFLVFYRVGTLNMIRKCNVSTILRILKKIFVFSVISVATFR